MLLLFFCTILVSLPSFSKKSNADNRTARSIGPDSVISLITKIRVYDETGYEPILKLQSDPRESQKGNSFSYLTWTAAFIQFHRLPRLVMIQPGKQDITRDYNSGRR